MSLLNGLSQMGSSIAQYAGAMGLDQMKHDQEMQLYQLSNDLIAQREHAGREEAADIAEAQQGRAQQFQSQQQEKQQQFESGQQSQRLSSQRDIAEMQMSAGRYQWLPGSQVDPNTNQVTQGMWKLPTRGGEAPVFVPGSQITPKYQNVTPNAALSQARRDWDYWVKRDKDNGGDGTVYNKDGSVADQSTWVTSQAQKYRSGQTGMPNAQPTQQTAPPLTAPASDHNAVIDAARAALKAGAPRDQVIKRLRDNGIEPPPGF